MNIELATDFMTDNKDMDIVVTLVDGIQVGGTALSVNSKGVNIKRDGKTRSIALSKIDSLDLVDDLDGDSDDMTDEEIYAELGDGMTTAELAAHLSDALKVDMTPKELRVHLRALGLGVGKGRKYSLTATEYRMVKDLVATA